MTSQSQPTDDETMGANLKALRGERDMSQTALAEAMVERGFSAWRQTTVSRTELGTRPLLLAEAEALQAILGRGLWRGTAASKSMDGRTLDQAREAIEEKITSVTRELEELRRLVGVYDMAARQSAGRAQWAADEAMEGKTFREVFGTLEKRGGGRG